jgi:hypothetical protein
VAGGNATNGVLDGWRGGPSPSTGRGGEVSPHGMLSWTAAVIGVFAEGTGVFERIWLMPAASAKRSIGK